MFRSLINDAKSAAGAVIGKYAMRVSVAVPFLVAAGFGTAALTILLADRLGSIAAYTVMAAGFAAIGALAAVAVSVKEQEEAVAGAAAEQTDTAETATDAAAQAAAQMPLALLGALLSTPLGPGAAVSGAKLIGRNLPLVAFLALVALLFWPAQGDDKGTAAEAAEGEAKSASEPGNGRWHEAAPDGMQQDAA